MKAKKFLNITKTVLVWIVLVVSVFMMVFTIVSVNTFDKNERSLFGYKFFIVRTDSMSATHFSAGDVIISKEVDLNTLRPDDVITFISQNSENLGQTITHAIREVTEDADGNIAFRTYGTTKNETDESLATMVIGQYQGKIPKLGYFFAFLKTTPGYIACVLVPFVLLLLSQGINCIRLFRKYRAEQLEDINAERKKIENEREESRKMMEELMALKAQLAASVAQANGEATVVAPESSEQSESEQTVEAAEAVEVAETEAAEGEGSESEAADEAETDVDNTDPETADSEVSIDAKIAEIAEIAEEPAVAHEVVSLEEQAQPEATATSEDERVTLTEAEDPANNPENTDSEPEDKASEQM